jgi:hypothetical protein
VLDELRAEAELHTAMQDEAGKPLQLGDLPRRPRRGRPPESGSRSSRLKQAWLPGLEPE